jgi:hypothetical protein
MGRFSNPLLASVIPPSTLIKYTTVVETGTLFGEGTELMSQNFKTVHTIEIQEALFEKAKAKFQGRPNIHCHLGDSVDVLRAFDCQEPTVFFLDAHWSGDGSVDWKTSSWKGYEVDTGFRGTNPIDPHNQNPLLEEIEILVKKIQGEFILYIDDADKFDEEGKGLENRCFTGENWTHLSLQKIESVLSGRIGVKHRSFDQIIYLVKAVEAS